MFRFAELIEARVTAAAAPSTKEAQPMTSQLTARQQTF